MRIRRFLPVLAAGLAIALASVGCATETSSEQVVREREERAYQRFIDEHRASSKSELEEPGIHFWRNSFHVVISLTDSGIDRFPEWACNKLLTTMYGYRVMDQTMVSTEEFHDLVLLFDVADIVEGEYVDTLRAVVRERDVRHLLDTYRD